MKCIQCGNKRLYASNMEKYKISQYKRENDKFSGIFLFRFLTKAFAECGYIIPSLIYKEINSKTSTVYCSECGKILEADPRLRVTTNRQ